MLNMDDFSKARALIAEGKTNSEISRELLVIGRED